MHANPKEIVRLTQEGNTAKQVAEALRISIRTVRRWKRRAISPHTLRLSRHQAKRVSTRPKSAPRLEALSRSQKEKIKELRRESAWGAERLGVALGLEVSPSTIHRFLLKEGLASGRRYRRPWYQDTTHRGLHNVVEPGTLQIDVKYVTPQLSGLVHTTYLYAGIDVFSRYKVGWIYPTLDSGYAAEALEYFFSAFPTTISFVQTDNGLEFQAQFQRTLALLSYPTTSSINLAK